MSTANTYLKVTELDFDEIRSNLKNYLDSQDQFKDYNFEGSVAATMLDVLAYNTHYNAYYINMLANEMFLDTAQQRDSVVSHAKLLGYTPTSSIGARAQVELVFSGVESGITQFTIPKNATFTTTVDDITYTYVTPEAYKVVKDGSEFSTIITIKEGEPLTHRFTVGASENERFIIPNKNIDMTSIVVRVQESITDTTTSEFTAATDIEQVFSTSPIYFLEESADEKYEIVFGSGSLGKSLKSGNIVIVDYLVCNGDATNGANQFTIGNLNINDVSYSGVKIDSVISSASGGTASESIKSIKFNAPRNYQTQNRCIIDNDYQRILIGENPDLQSVIAFGGEKAIPAIYGKVYIAAKPYGELYLTSTRKQQLKGSIVDRTPLGIDPVFIDPDYTYIIPTITVYYDLPRTTSTTGAIEQIVRNTVKQFSENNLERFGNRLRYSRFVRKLDDAQDGYILNNDAALKLEKRIVPNTNVAEKMQIEFNNPIRSKTLESSQFTFNGFLVYIDDDGEGNVRIYRFDENNQKLVVQSNAGTIDYDAGSIIIENFAPSDYVDNYMRINVFPKNLDIIPIREQILIMDYDEATINLVGES